MQDKDNTKNKKLKAETLVKVKWKYWPT